MGTVEGWQAQKSEIMRRQILDATIQCLVKHGYAMTTTTEIAAEAGVSRGAMSHHFANKRQLMQETIAYLNQLRIENFRRDMAAIGAGPDRANRGIEAYWRLLSDPLFTAFHELTCAARIDPELEQVLLPAMAEFNRQWYETAYQGWPEWQNKGELFDLAMDLTQFLMEGMAVSRIGDDNPERYARMRRYLVARLGEIFAAAESGEHGKAVESIISFKRPQPAHKDVR